MDAHGSAVDQSRVDARTGPPLRAPVHRPSAARRLHRIVSRALAVTRTKAQRCSSPSRSSRVRPVVLSQLESGGSRTAPLPPLTSFVARGRPRACGTHPLALGAGTRTRWLAAAAMVIVAAAGWAPVITANQGREQRAAERAEEGERAAWDREKRATSPRRGVYRRHSRPRPRRITRAALDVSSRSCAYEPLELQSPNLPQSRVLRRARHGTAARAPYRSRRATTSSRRTSWPRPTEGARRVRVLRPAAARCDSAARRTWSCWAAGSGDADRPVARHRSHRPVGGLLADRTATRQDRRAPHQHGHADRSHTTGSLHRS